MPLQHTYDPASVLVIFGGVPLSGFADGTFVNVEFNEDDYSLQVGTDGEGTRSKTNNQSARVTVSLMQSSNVNDVLSAMRQLDLNTPAGNVLPLMIKDGTGRSLFAAEAAWIVKGPSAEYGREAVAREWMFETHELIAAYGGN